VAALTVDLLPSDLLPSSCWQRKAEMAARPADIWLVVKVHSGGTAEQATSFLCGSSAIF
jgi:hypothetical protein